MGAAAHPRGGLAVSGLRQTVSGASRRGGAPGAHAHRGAGMLLASPRLRGHDDAEVQCGVLAGEVGSQRGTRPAA